jgi:hypothetical protein
MLKTGSRQAQDKLRQNVVLTEEIISLARASPGRNGR